MTQLQTVEIHRPARILIVDDDPDVRQGLQGILKRAGHLPLEAADGKTALDVLGREEVDLVLLDLQMPRISGMNVLRQTVMDYPNLPVIIVSGKGDIPKAIEATRLGALDFLEKPVEVEQLLSVVHNALENVDLTRRHNRSLEEAWERYDIIGANPKMQEVYRLIDKAAGKNVRVLITGESGTGKERVAHAIHRNSDRDAGPFVAINCATIPETLIESELFGIEEKIATGVAARKGTFEQAHTGTLFLDEIGDMSLMTQTKVLRALEENVVRRVGSTKVIPVDVRIVAATNKNLKAEINEGNFREDLYWRLNVIHIPLPALRERWQDVPALIEHFLAHYGRKHRVAPRKLAPGAMVLLSEYDWPGNVREIKNVVERFIVLGDGPTISLQEVEQALEQPGEVYDDPQVTLRQARVHFERRYILSTLQANDWQIQLTATTLGIARGHLWKKMKQFGIEQPD